MRNILGEEPKPKVATVVEHPLFTKKYLESEVL